MAHVHCGLPNDTVEPAPVQLATVPVVRGNKAAKGGDGFACGKLILENETSTVTTAPTHPHTSPHIHATVLACLCATVAPASAWLPAGQYFRFLGGRVDLHVTVRAGSRRWGQNVGAGAGGDASRVGAGAGPGAGTNDDRSREAAASWRRRCVAAASRWAQRCWSSDDRKSRERGSTPAHPSPLTLTLTLTSTSGLFIWCRTWFRSGCLRVDRKAKAARFSNCFMVRQL